MRLEILGASGTFPSPREACSGYLLQDDGFSLWMDAGTGTMANIPLDADLTKINGVFLSHMHPDHFVDIYPLFFALSFHPERPRRVPVLAPPGSLAFAGRLMSDDAMESFVQVFDWREVGPGEEMEIGPFRLQTFDSIHSTPNLTLRISSGGKTICYSGDTGPNPNLAIAARNVDFFLCEASWQRDTEVNFGPIHLRAFEAGMVAAESEVARLMLTHIWPTLDAERSGEEAAKEFDGVIEIARAREGTDL
ncbi:MAG: MBL fold metallo-hydrolase [Actinomycetota bacterium]|nr:MBL fold metallo-hydrolase [Actinomycetota bacterium]